MATTGEGHSDQALPAKPGADPANAGGAEPETLASDCRTVLDPDAAVQLRDEPAGTRPAPPVPGHELLRCIGRGSYGEVWLARNVMGTYRAVKIVYRDAFDHAGPFEREFNGIKKFEPISRSHEGLVDVPQIGRTELRFYYMMEVADGVEGGQEIDPASYIPKTLWSEVTAQGRLRFEPCVEVALMLTQGLAHMHKHGLIHRDIKPSNIIFMHSIAELADIGLVAEQSEAKSFVGTEGFIPPEGPARRGCARSRAGVGDGELFAGGHYSAERGECLPASIHAGRQLADYWSKSRVCARAARSIPCRARPGGHRGVDRNPATQPVPGQLRLPAIPFRGHPRLVVPRPHFVPGPGAGWGWARAVASRNPAAGERRRNVASFRRHKCLASVPDSGWVDRAAAGSEPRR